MANIYAKRSNMKEIGPQPGPQVTFLSTTADIAIYGGAAGGGKTWSLLFEPLRHAHNPEFTSITFRRTFPQIKNEGGLWDESGKIYPALDAIPKKSEFEWQFPSGMTCRFSHLEHEDSVYDWQGAQIPLINFDELTHFCMHPDTDVLTESGWKRIADIQKGEKVASLAPGRSIEYQEVLDTPSFDYDGELVHIHQRNGISCRVTPNHRMVVDTQAQHGGWKFIRADHFLETVQTVPRTGNWSGDVGTCVELPIPKGRGHGRNANNVPNVSMDDWLEFLGWYMSEGCAFDTQSPVVSIRQIKTQPTLIALLDRLGWKYFATKCGQFIICSRQLFNVVKPLGNTYSKRIPRWVFTLCKRQLRIFWDAFILGDGHRTMGGAIQIGLANERLIDDLQEMAFLLGYVATKGHYVTQTGFDVWSLSVSKSRTATQVKPKNVSLQPYKGKVYCLTVSKNNTFYARDNGRCCWTGNSERQFFYLMSRNRSMCGVKPYMRGTCNPDANSWVKVFCAPWVDDQYEIKGGFGGQAKSGEVRHFIRENGQLKWVKKGTPRSKSLTFVFANVYDNKKLLEANPEYLDNLFALPLVEQERLLRGNWNIVESGNMFRAEWLTPQLHLPGNFRRLVRFWDLAGTKVNERSRVHDPDYTAGALVAEGLDGKYYFLDLALLRDTPGNVEKKVKETAESDCNTFGRVEVWIEQEPGSSGEIAVEHYKGVLSGFPCKGYRSTGDKVTRAKPVSRACQFGFFIMKQAVWNADFLAMATAFPTKEVHDDPVDAISGAYTILTLPPEKIAYNPQVIAVKSGWTQ